MTDPLATMTPPTGTPTARPSWRGLHARPDAVHHARHFAATCVFGYPYDPYEIELITSELVTNAIIHACDLRPWDDDLWPISLEITPTLRWLHLVVVDPDHRPLPGADVGGLTAEHGRGLTIVDRLAAARWVAYEEHGKAVHVALAAPGVELTAAELAGLGVPQ